MKGGGGSSYALPAKRRWRRVIGVLVLVFLSMLVPLAFLLGLHNGFLSTGTLRMISSFHMYCCLVGYLLPWLLKAFIRSHFVKLDFFLYILVCLFPKSWLVSLGRFQVIVWQWCVKWSGLNGFCFITFMYDTDWMGLDIYSFFCRRFRWTTRLNICKYLFLLNVAGAEIKIKCADLFLIVYIWDIEWASWFWRVGC